MSTTTTTKRKTQREKMQILFTYDGKVVITINAF
jgi:hypothetical protein